MQSSSPAFRWERALLYALLISLCVGYRADAASNYSQNFASGASGWVAVPPTSSDTWYVENGYYRNTTSTLQRSIAYYGGDTWTTGFVYQVSMYSDYSGGGNNKIGAVFNYVDSQNYYEVLINMLGDVLLNRVNAGVRTTLATGQVPVPGAIPGIDQWFNVAIERSGSNVTIRVGNATALANVPLPTSPAGRIGVFSHFNLTRFDNVSVTMTGGYEQNFSSGAASWTAVPSPATDTWYVENGYYRNTTSSLQRSIAYYSGNTWTTGYTYRVSMYADYSGQGANKIGAVFNYRDPQNYYEVLIDMLGNVSLNNVSAGTRTTLATGQVSVPGAVPGVDQWFNVAIERSNANVTVRVGNETALQAIPLPASPAGHVGVFAHYNLTRFDNVSVTTNAGAATRLFRSGFESGLNLVGPTCVGPGDPAQGVWMVDLTGTDSVTGQSWPPTFWGPPSVRAVNTILPCNYAFANYLDVSFKNVAGPTGTTTRVLSNTVKNTAYINGNIPRAGVSYGVGEQIPQNHFYVRRYLKYSSHVMSNITSHDWFVQHEFKARGCTTPRRLILYWHSNENAEPYYRLVMDKANNCLEGQEQFVPVFEKTCYPLRPNQSCPQFPVGQWFYDEYFVQYSENGTSQDRIAYAINGQVIFDHREPVATPPHKGIKMTPGYLNIPNVEIQVDDLEVYETPPCGSFPCGAPPHN